jgi:ribosomal protein S18 acetylase RimI-like enzyme
MNSIVYKRVSTEQELRQILELQRANISTLISPDEKLIEGFVTIKHSFEVLKAMNDTCAHIIAKCDDNVVGYTLSMVKEFKDFIPILKPMFKEIDKCLTGDISFIAMGQVCVDKAYRKQGIFRGLYEFMRQELNNEYDVIITEVDANNIRSVNAHKAVGFELLKTYTSNNKNWEVIIWNWK